MFSSEFLDIDQSLKFLFGSLGWSFLLSDHLRFGVLRSFQTEIRLLLLLYNI